MPRVQVEPGVELNCPVDDFLWPWQSATPVVFQHGMGRNAQFWNRWVPFVGEAHRVFRPELRGCGESWVPPVDIEFDPSTVLADIVAVLDSFKLDRVNWIGESSGARVGMLLAAHAPERVRSLVLCDAGYQQPSADAKRVNSIDQPSSAKAIEMYGTTEWCRRTIHLRLDIERASPELVDWYVGEMGRTPPHVAAAYHSYHNELDLSPLLPSIKAPVLLLNGDKSLPFATQSRSFAEKLPNGRLHVIKDCGHGVFLVAAEECIKEVRAFWNDLGDE